MQKNKIKIKWNHSFIREYIKEVKRAFIHNNKKKINKYKKEGKKKLYI